MRFKSATMAVTLSLASVSVVGVMAAPAYAVSCPDNNWSIKDGRIGQFFDGDFINIRTGPSTQCTSVGQGQHNHSVRLDCWKFGENGNTWSHLRDRTTGKVGWVKDSLLVGNGAVVQC